MSLAKLWLCTPLQRINAVNHKIIENRWKIKRYIQKSKIHVNKSTKLGWKNTLEQEINIITMLITIILIKLYNVSNLLLKDEYNNTFFCLFVTTQTNQKYK